MASSGLMSKRKETSMKPLLFGVFLLFALSNLNTETVTWEPPRGNTQVEIWPEAVPDAQPLPGPESAKTEKESLVAGKLWISVTNVSRPAMTIYEPKGKNTGVAMVVFPGGGFRFWPSILRARKFAIGSRPE